MTPRGLAFVFLHFFGSSGREWAGVVDRLGPTRRTMTIDLQGFGDAANRAPLGVRGMADEVDRQVIDARLGACVLVGHSMSAKVAALLAARSPSWLAGLVLVTASPPSPEPMDAAAKRKLLAFDGSRDAAADYIDGLTAARLPDALREVAIADAMRASAAAWQAWIVAGSQEDCAAQVGTIDLPAHVVAGAEDPSLGAEIQQALVVPHFPRASFVTIAGGHALPLENAADLGREILQFATSLESDVHHPSP